MLYYHLLLLYNYGHVIKNILVSKIKQDFGRLKTRWLDLAINYLEM